MTPFSLAVGPTGSGLPRDMVTSVVVLAVVSVSYTHLDVYKRQTLSVTACDSYTSPDGLDTWTESGLYLDTLSNAVGCDSIITIDLTINHSTASEIIAESCGSFVSPDGSETWTESGIYMDTIVNQLGCDSVITIQLTIFDNTAAEITVDACDNFTSPSGIYVWTTSGIYNDTIPNAGGCDSIITIDLTINLSTCLLYTSRCV